MLHVLLLAAAPLFCFPMSIDGKAITEKGTRRNDTYCVSAAKTMAITENRKNNRIWGRWIVRKWRKKKRERKETLHTASGTCYFALYWPKPCTPETQERLADPQIQRLDPQCTKSRSSRMLTLDDWLVIANTDELCFLVTFTSNSIVYLAWS